MGVLGFYNIQKQERDDSMKTERIRQLEQYNNDHDVVTIPNLLAHFKVSINTIRRDLNELEKEGKIEKIYGGAKKCDSGEKSRTALSLFPNEMSKTRKPNS